MPTIIDCTCEECQTVLREHAATVGTPNTPTEEVIPETFENVTIELPSDAARNVFENLDLASQLTASRDASTWETVLEDFNSRLAPIEHPVQVGNYAREMREPVLPSGGVVTFLRREAADEIVRIASNGRLTLEDTDGRPSLRPPTSLENEGWKLYLGTPFGMRTYDPNGNGNNEVSIYDLREHLGYYQQFRRSERRRYIRQALQNARATASQKKDKAAGWNKEGADKFDKFLKHVRESLVVEPDAFSVLPILPRKTASSRNYGIEIEAVDIAGVKTPAGWMLKPDGSLRGLNHSSIASRSQKHDDDCADQRIGYCVCSRSREDIGPRTEVGEWNSPVLRSFHSRGLQHITDAIEHRRTNYSPGIHVHVEAKDLTPAQASQLSVIYSTLEPLWEQEYQRLDRKYCKAVDTPELIERFNKAREAKQGGLKSTDMQFGKRYWTVNMASLNSHGTIEFRAMGAKYNYDHLVRWAYFCREIVNIAKANVPQRAWTSVRTMKDLVVLFAKYGKETPTPEWAGESTVTDVIAALGTENRRQPHIAKLDPNNQYSPDYVFDDYTLKATRLTETTGATLSW